MPDEPAPVEPDDDELDGCEAVLEDDEAVEDDDLPAPYEPGNDE